MNPCRSLFDRSNLLTFTVYIYLKALLIIYFSRSLSMQYTHTFSLQPAQIKNVLRLKQIKQNLVMLWPLSIVTLNKGAFVSLTLR